MAGALRGIHAEALLPPYPKGWISAVAAPATWTDLLGARAERVPDYSSYLSRIPGSATDSESSIHPRKLPWIAPASALVGPSTFAPVRVRASRCGPTLPQARLHALLNACAAGESTVADRSQGLAPSNAGAASESTTAGSLEAFSQGTAGTERIENANSKTPLESESAPPRFS